jgi:hypothetical protein
MKSHVFLLVKANEYPPRPVETPELDAWLESTGWQRYAQMMWWRPCPPFEVLDLAKAIEPHIPKGVFSVLWYANTEPTIYVRMIGGEPPEVLFY